MMGAWVYVDGFNLYYGALKGRPYRWLDLKRLSTEILPAGRPIDKIKYFTARVSGASDPDAPKRQQAYINAISTIPEIEIIYGNFLSKTVWRPLINAPLSNRDISLNGKVVANLNKDVYDVDGKRPQKLIIDSYPNHNNASKKKRGNVKPISGALILEVHTMEEKGSDVNLASHLINDAWNSLFTEALVISNDTDLITPIDMVVRERGLDVTVATPQIDRPVAWGLQSVASFTYRITRKNLRDSQLPNPVRATAGRQIHKPISW